MNEFLGSQLFLLTFTVGIYLAALWLYRRTGVKLLHPLLTSVAVIIIFLKTTGMPFAEYRAGTQFIDFMLGLAVVSLGYLLYEQLEDIRRRWVSILTSVVIGSTVGIVSVVLISRWLGADKAVEISLEPKSVTMPIALSVSAAAGGIPAITSIAVIFTGIFGGMVGPFVLQKLGVTDRIARGLALGSGAHAIGTARAIELGAVEGAISGLAIGLMGLVTAILVPILQAIL